MIPQTAKTGKVNIRENGFTSYFSVDAKTHSFSVKYYEKEKWRAYPDHLKEYVAELVSSVWVAAIPAENKVFTSKLSEADVELMEFIAYQTQGFYRHEMGYPSIEDSPELHVTLGEKDWSDWELRDDECSLFFSGGRDAFCTLGILEDAGYEPHLHMHNNDTSWDAGELARETFQEEGRELDTIWSNFPLVKREITREHDIYWQLEAPKFFMMFFSLFPILEQELVIFGNEATTTRFVRIAKERILHKSWEQSQITNYRMTQWAEKSGLPIRTGSVIREMADYRVVKELAERWPNYDDIARSCFFVNTKDDDYPACSRCHKDFRNFMAREAIGADTSRYDEERLEEFKIEAEELMWKTLLTEDFLHMNELSNMFPLKPKKEFEPVEGLMFRPTRANPSYFLNEDEFVRIYESAMDDDYAWIPSEPGPRWISYNNLSEVYDTISDWDTGESFEFQLPIKDNNSLLNFGDN